ncbi:hypothetical protein [Streptomyces poonensis]|uniref:Uncharacterized protein n=1 Tax=Streptomyces poonensis TaxID=68255 RepID=A0A918UKM3_9ACTN|nr:hypothetical protein [Streptomyces poonensis]GGZ16502.1 hypothetical protein GCM10010365_40640 [Streptomyces poonensis]GLJ90834.1 hypothetical protein GCM10017589_34400 [Streptomyces poonensis]
MSEIREAVPPRQVRAAQLLLLSLAFVGVVVLLALQDGLTYHGMGELLAPWLLVWVCALLAVTYDGRARGGVRMTTIVLMVFVVVGSLDQVFGAEDPAAFVDAALRVALGLPAVVLLFLPEARDWFERER